MKLLELIPKMKSFTRIKRDKWNYYIIRSTFEFHPLIIIDLNSMQLINYIPTYEDLISDDWEIAE